MRHCKRPMFLMQLLGTKHDLLAHFSEVAQILSRQPPPSPGMRNRAHQLTLVWTKNKREREREPPSNPPMHCCPTAAAAC